MQGAHHIRFPSLQWVFIGSTYQGLRGEMKNKIWLCRSEGVLYRCPIPDVDAQIVDGFCNVSDLKMRRQGGRLKRYAHYFRAELLQPRGKPSAFKASMPSDKNSLTLKCVLVRHQLKSENLGKKEVI
jgi:hypothetical protein